MSHSVVAAPGEALDSQQYYLVQVSGVCSIFNFVLLLEYQLS